MALIRARLTSFLVIYPFWVDSDFRTRLDWTAVVEWLHLCGGRVPRSQAQIHFSHSSRENAAETFLMPSLQFPLMLSHSVARPT